MITTQGWNKVRGKRYYKFGGLNIGKSVRENMNDQGASELKPVTNTNEMLLSSLNQLRTKTTLPIGSNFVKLSESFEKQGSFDLKQFIKDGHSNQDKAIQKLAEFFMHGESASESISETCEQIMQILKKEGFSENKLGVINSWLLSLVSESNSKRLKPSAIQAQKDKIISAVVFGIDSLAGVPGQNALKAYFDNLNKSTEEVKKLTTVYDIDFAYLGIPNDAWDQTKGDKFIGLVFEYMAIWRTNLIKKYPSIVVDIFRAGGDELKIIVKFNNQEQKKQFENEYQSKFTKPDGEEQLTITPQFNEDLRTIHQNLYQKNKQIEGDVKIGQNKKALTILCNQFADISSNLSKRGDVANIFLLELKHIIDPILLKSIRNSSIANPTNIKTRLSDIIFGENDEDYELVELALQKLDIFFGAIIPQITEIESTAINGAFPVELDSGMKNAGTNWKYEDANSSDPQSKEDLIRYLLKIIAMGLKSVDQTRKVRKEVSSQ